MIRVPTHRETNHSERLLLEEFLNPMSLSQRDWRRYPLALSESGR